VTSLDRIRDELDAWRDEFDYDPYTYRYPCPEADVERLLAIAEQAAWVLERYDNSLIPESNHRHSLQERMGHLREALRRLNSDA
jgi:hypothetical protein